MYILDAVKPPSGTECWKLLDDAMIEAAKSQIACRRLIALDGPFGLGLKVVPFSDSEIVMGSPRAHVCR